MRKQKENSYLFMQTISKSGISLTLFRKTGWQMNKFEKVIVFIACPIVHF